MFGWSIVRVVGDSMSPTLDDGDYVIARSIGSSVCRNGTVVLIHHPTLGPIVKRVVSRDRSGRYVVEGDNTLSTTSESLGALEATAIQAAVRWKVSPYGLHRIGKRMPDPLDTVSNESE